MKIPLSLFLAPLALVTTNAADSICVKYTKAIFGEDTGENELALLTQVVNLAVLGDPNVSVPGILAPEGGLAPFFSGDGPTTNRGNTATVVDFLDGAAELPNPSPSSNTSILLDHLYQFFGALLGCSAADFPPYNGIADMFEVHKFMGITQEMNDFFIDQVGLSASALGVTDDDVAIIATVLDTTFNTRCPPPVTENDGLPEFLVGTNPSICQANSCPLAAESPCVVAEDPLPQNDDVTSGSERRVAAAAAVCAVGATILFGLA